jgi:thymidine kinase
MKSVLHPFLLQQISILAQGCDVVGIDEAQFFDDEIVKICNDLVKGSSDCCWIRYGF